MADQYQMTILREGVAAWNEWRKANPKVEIDLSKADLSGADLTGADLSGANLARIDLSDANLSKADLFKAYLTSANLSDANLSDANLSKADLYGADLYGADLGGADLGGADLARAKSILQVGPTGSWAAMLYAVRHQNGIFLKTRCFWGDVPAFQAALETTHPEGTHRLEYEAVLALIREWAANHTD